MCWDTLNTCTRFQKQLPGKSLWDRSFQKRAEPIRLYLGNTLLSGLTKYGEHLCVCCSVVSYNKMM